MPLIIKSGVSTARATVGSTSKALYVNAVDSRGVDRGKKASYAACTAAAQAIGSTSVKQFSVLAASASKTIRLQRVRVSGTCGTAAIYADVKLLKLSTNPSSGTAVTLTQVPLISSSAAGSSGLCVIYSAEPTEGTVTGTIGSATMFAPITGTPATGGSIVDFNFAIAGELETPVLVAGGTQAFALKIGTAYSNALTLNVEWYWTEE